MGGFHCPIHLNRVEIMKGQTPLIKLINIHIKDLPVVNSPRKKKVKWEALSLRCPVCCCCNPPVRLPAVGFSSC